MILIQINAYNVESTYSNSVPIRDVVLKTYRKQ